MNDEPLRRDRRHAEMRWLGENRAFLWENYAGKWICVQDSQLISSADSLAEALKLAREKGIENPLVTAVRRKDYQDVILIR